MKRILLLTAFLLCSLASYGQLWSGILDPTTAIDWTHVGVEGIPARTSICSTLSATGSNQAAAINTALSGCTSGQAVLLNAGTYLINSNVTVPSNVTLRGAGADLTILDAHGTSGYAVTLGSSSNNPAASAALNITAGATQGSTVVTLASTTGVSVGKFAVINELNFYPEVALNGGPGGGTCASGGADCYTVFGQTRGNGEVRARGQTVEITGVSGSVITFKPALYIDYLHTLPAWAATTVYGFEAIINNGTHFYYQTARKTVSPFTCTSGGTIPTFPTNGTSVNDGNCTWLDGGTGTTTQPTLVPYTATVLAGVEDLQVKANNTGLDADFGSNECSYCWFKGVEANYTDGDVVDIYWGFKNEVRDSYFSNAFLHTPGTHDDAITLSYATSETLVENNIIERLHVATMVRSGVSGNVFGYNYTAGGYDVGAINFMIGAHDAHTAHTQFNLVEGSYYNGVALDSTWGTHSRNTFMRNFVSGTSITCKPITDNVRNTVNCSPFGFPQQSGKNSWNPFQAARAFSYDYTATLTNNVGNVVGSTMAQAMVNTSNSPLSDTNIINCCSTSRSYDTVAYNYSFGFSGASDDGTFASDVTTTQASTLIHGDYSNITSAIQWATGITHTLPASFYHATKPSWWGSLPWPAIGPDVTGGTGPGGHSSLTASNPAQNCYINVMGGVEGGTGSPLSFNANTCYGGSGVTSFYQTTPGSGQTVWNQPDPPFRYSATTALDIRSVWANPIPDMSSDHIHGNVGAGVSTMDPSFPGTKIIRCTDKNTNGFTNTIWNGPSGSQVNLWNADNTKFIINTTGGASVVMNWDKTTQTCSNAGVTPWVTTVIYSILNKDKLFSFENGTTNQDGAQITPYLWNGTTYVKQPIIADFISQQTCSGVSGAGSCSTNCLPPSSTSPYVPFNFTYHSLVQNDQLDQVFMTGFSNNGGQGAAGHHYIVNWTLGKGCRVMDSLTGAVNGDWGEVSKTVSNANASNTVSGQYTFSGPTFDASWVNAQNTLYGVNSGNYKRVYVTGCTNSAYNSDNNSLVQGSPFFEPWKVLSFTSTTLTVQAPTISGQTAVTDNSCKLTQVVGWMDRNVLHDPTLDRRGQYEWSGTASPSCNTKNDASSIDTGDGNCLQTDQWDIPTMNWWHINNNVSGHKPHGYKYFLGGGEVPLNPAANGQWVVHSFDDPNNQGTHAGDANSDPSYPSIGVEIGNLFYQNTPPGATLPVTLTNCYDSHQSWENDNNYEQPPMFMASWWPGTTTGCGAPPPTVTVSTACSEPTRTCHAHPWDLTTGAGPDFNAAWENEIIAMSLPDHKAYRFAHTYSTDASNAFGIAYSQGIVSNNGRYFYFGSDWMGTLGSISGEDNCTINGNISTTETLNSQTATNPGSTFVFASATHQYVNTDWYPNHVATVTLCTDTSYNGTYTITSVSGTGDSITVPSGGVTGHGATTGCKVTTPGTACRGDIFMLILQ
jgi:hypothetical protein